MLRIDKSHAKTLSIFDPRLSWQDGVSSKTYLDPLFPVVEPSSYSIFHNISYLTSHVSLFVFLHNIYKPFHSHDLIGNYLDFFLFLFGFVIFFIFFPRSWQDKKHFSISFTELKIYLLSYTIYKHAAINIADPSSMQDACHI